MYAINYFIYIKPMIMIIMNTFRRFWTVGVHNQTTGDLSYLDTNIHSHEPVDCQRKNSSYKSIKVQEKQKQVSMHFKCT
jgi:hypothetical protein